jgi:hypothetical protein
VKQLAWLNSRPRPEGEKAEPDTVPPTRLEVMKKQGIEPAMPPVSPVLFDNPAMPFGRPVLVEWLLEIGPTEPAGMGMATIGWATIGAWEKATGIDLNPWQSKLLRRLSGDWYWQSEQARKWDCPAPYQTRETIAAQRGAVGAHMRRAMGGPPARQPKRG